MAPRPALPAAAGVNDRAIASPADQDLDDRRGGRGDRALRVASDPPPPVFPGGRGPPRSARASPCRLSLIACAPGRDARRFGDPLAAEAKGVPCTTGSPVSP